MRSKFCFTINNYTGDDLAMIKQLDDTNIEFGIFGLEEAPSTGTPHIQGYIHTKSEYADNKRLIKRFPFLARAHIIDALGSDLENFNYCSKECVLMQIGVPALQGKRNDLSYLRHMIVDENIRVRDLLGDIKNYQQLKFAEALQKYQRPKQTFKRKNVVWIYGETGLGKTRRALELAGDDYWISSRNLKWWDGYIGQKSVIIDDFRCDFCTFHELLRILDGYPFRSEVKASSLWLDAETIIITSPYSPIDVYETIEDKSQLLRRISKVIHLKKK